MLIAGKIIEKVGGDFELLCIYYNENEKYDYYYRELEKVCVNSIKFLIQSKTKVDRFKEMFNFIFFIKQNFNKKYNNVYLASIDNSFFHIFLSKVSFLNLYTYDDGSANINNTSSYYLNKKESIYQKIILLFLGNKFSLNEILQKTKKHYTIYKGLSNIVNCTEDINLFEQNESIVPDKVINIFLGQPSNEFDEINYGDALSFVQGKSVNYYYPHPREVERFDNFIYIESKYIFEDYIVKLLKENYLINVYTINSTAGFNVIFFNNVKVYVVLNDQLKTKFYDFYNLYENNGAFLYII